MSFAYNPPGRSFGSTMKPLLLIVAAMQLAACNTWQGMTAREDVKPWQRGVLARPEMQLDSAPLISGLDDHIYFSKEASSGGRAFGGGGCGCN